MVGKTQLLIRFAERMLMCKPDSLLLIYFFCDDLLNEFDKRHLYYIGIPAKEMETKDVLKEYIFDLGISYVVLKRDCKFRILFKQIKKLWEQIVQIGLSVK